jgi:hypothetical protein
MKIMSKIRNGKAKWNYFRKSKHKRSRIRQVMYVASMVGVVSAAKRRIAEKKRKGILVTKTYEYGE